MIRILVVDDHPLIRKGIKQIISLEPEMSLVDEAKDGAEALECLKRQAIDIVILDLNLPKISGLEVLEKIKEMKSDVKVLILSIHSEEEYAVRALKSGASGFISKDADLEIMLGAIKKIYAGERYITPSMAEIAVSLVGLPEKPSHEILSNREFYVMKMIAAGKSPKTIAELLDISPRTVSSYRVRIFRKMKFTTNVDAVRYCMDHKITYS